MPGEIGRPKRRAVLVDELDGGECARRCEHVAADLGRRKLGAHRDRATSRAPSAAAAGRGGSRRSAERSRHRAEPNAPRAWQRGPRAHRRREPRARACRPSAKRKDNATVVPGASGVARSTSIRCSPPGSSRTASPAGTESRPRGAPCGAGRLPRRACGSRRARAAGVAAPSRRSAAPAVALLSDRRRPCVAPGGVARIQASVTVSGSGCRRAGGAQDRQNENATRARRDRP